MVKTPTDEQLLADHLAGRPDAFELVVRRHSTELFRFVLRFTGNSVAAEDVVQETFLQVHQSAVSFDPQRRFKPWLFTIGANKARDWLRTRSRRSELPLDAQIDGDGEGGERSFRDLLMSDEADPGGDMEVEERRRIVRGAVEEVPLMLREVLVLAYYHRIPYKDVAEILHIPVGTVKSRLHAAVGYFAKVYRERTSESHGDPDAWASRDGDDSARGRGQ